MMVLCLLCWSLTVFLVAGLQQKLVQNLVKTREISRIHRLTTKNRSQRFFVLHFTVNPPSTTEKLPWVYDKTPKSAKEKARFGSQVPFKEDVYETMKGAIEILTKRLNMNKVTSKMDMSKLSIDERALLAMKSLTVEESLWFADAIEVNNILHLISPNTVTISV